MTMAVQETRWARGAARRRRPYRKRGEPRGAARRRRTYTATCDLGVGWVWRSALGWSPAEEQDFLGSRQKGQVRGDR